MLYMYMYSRRTKVFVADVKMAAVCLHYLHNKKYCPNFNIVCLPLILGKLTLHPDYFFQSTRNCII